MTTLRPSSHRTAGALKALLALAVLGLSYGPSAAVSAKVRSACAGDYSNFCPAYPPDSAKARQCMRQAGKRLSTGCIDALADAGEIRRPRR